MVNPYILPKPFDGLQTCDEFEESRSLGDKNGVLCCPSKR